MKTWEKSHTEEKFGKKSFTEYNGYELLKTFFFLSKVQETY